MKYRLNVALLFVLVTSLLTMQWASAHIHVASHHDHDGSHHQHVIETHAHQLSSHDRHLDTIDSSHQTDDANVVTLDHPYNTVKRCQHKSPSVAVIHQAYQDLASIQTMDVKLPITFNTQLSHLNYSPAKPRAPPRFS